MLNDKEITMPPENARVAYLAHPYGGSKENIAKAAAMRVGLQEGHPDTTIFSPVEHFSPLEGHVNEPAVMRHCLTILRRCDVLWAAPGYAKSQGCALEIAYAHAHGIPVVYLWGCHE